jgi:hypothetical protein
LEKGFEKWEAGGAAIVVSGLIEAAKFDKCLAARFRGSHARAQVVGDVQFEVSSEFRIEITIELACAEQVAEAVPGSAEWPHELGSSALRKRARMAVA